MPDVRTLIASEDWTLVVNRLETLLHETQERVFRLSCKESISTRLLDIPLHKRKDAAGFRTMERKD
jgi:hypothetical protein